MWDQPVGGQGGFHLGLNAAGITNAGSTPNAQSRNVNTIRIEDTGSWLKGRHSINLGGSFDRMDSWNTFRRTVPLVSFRAAQGAGAPRSAVIQAQVRLKGKRRARAIASAVGAGPPRSSSRRSGR